MDCSLSNLVSSLRLARASRGASRPFYPVVSLLVRIVLIRLVRASRSSSRSIVSSRLACSLRSSHLRFLVSVPFYLVPSSIRLVVPSCRGILLARLVSFSFVLSPCGYVMRRSCGACYPYHHDRRAARSLRLVRSLLIRLDGVGGIRARPVLSAHEAMRAARHWEERRDELNETARRQACGNPARRETS